MAEEGTASTSTFVVAPPSLSWRRELASRAVICVAIAEIEGQPVIVTGDAEGRVRRWNATTGSSYGDPIHVGPMVRALALGRRAAGVTIAVVQPDRVHLLDFETGTEIARVGLEDLGELEAVAAVTGTVGPQFVVGGALGARLLGSDTQGIGGLFAEVGGVRSLAAVTVGAGEVVVVGGRDGRSRVFDPWHASQTGTTVGLAGAAEPVAASAVASLGDQAVTIVAHAGRIDVLDSFRGSPLTPIQLVADDVSALLGLELQGSLMVVVGTTGGEIRCFDIARGEPGPRLRPHSASVRGLARFDIRGRPHVASVGDDGLLCRFDLEAGALIGSSPAGRRSLRSLGMIRTLDRHVVLTGESEAVAYCVDASADGVVRRIEAGQRSPVTGIGIVAGPEGREHFALGSASGEIMLVDPTDGRPVGLVAERSAHVPDTAMTMVEGSGTDVVVASADGHLDLINTSANTRVELTGALGEISSLAAMDLGGTRIIAVGQADGLVVVRRRRRSGSQTMSPSPVPDGVTALAMGMIGGQARLLVGSGTGRVEVRDPTDSEIIATSQPVHAGAVSSLTLCRLPAGDIIVSASEDGTIQLLDATTCASIGAPLAGHTEAVRAVRVAANGDSVAVLSVGDDGAIVLWGTLPTPPGTRLSVTTRLVNDAVSREDLLGLQSIADAVNRFLVHDQTKPPLSIAFKGSWGQGKSTLMHLTREKLDPTVPHTGERATIRPRTLQQPSQRWWRRLTRRDDRPRVRDALVGVAHEERPHSDATSLRVTVGFNPWAYQTGEQVWSGLAHEIIEQVTGRMSVADREWFWLRLNRARVDRYKVRRAFYSAVVERLMKPFLGLAITAVVLAFLGFARTAWSVGTGGVAATALGTALWVSHQSAATLYGSLVGGPVYARVRAARDALGSIDDYAPDPAYATRTGYVHLIQTDIKRVIELVATPESPLVIFIDDLDRCAPSVVMQVLEAINLFLAGEIPNTIVVLGIEPTMLAAHIQTSHADLITALRDRDPSLRHDDLSWRFLEKLLQLSLRVPEASEANLSRYLARLLGDVSDLTAGARSDSAPPPNGRSSTAVAPDPPPSISSNVQPGVSRAPGDDAAMAVPTTGQPEAGSRTSPTGLFGPSDPEGAVSNVVRERAASAIAAAEVDRILSLANDAVRAAISERLARIGANPRGLKRLVNLFVFQSYVAAERGLLPRTEVELQAQLASVLDACELMVRWPHLVDRLARRAAGSADGRSVLVALVEGDRAEEEWATAVVRHGLIPPPLAEAPAVVPTAVDRPLADLHEFLFAAERKISLIAALI